MKTETIAVAVLGLCAGAAVCWGILARQPRQPSSPPSSPLAAEGVAVTQAPYGAICDGATDDAAAINAAIKAAGSGARVYIPSGRRCALGAQLLLNGVNLDFDCNNATLVAIAKMGGVFQVNGSFNRVRNCTIDARRLASSGIWVTGHHNGIERNVVLLASSHGIGFDGERTSCSHNWARDNAVFEAGGIGLSQWRCDWQRVEGNTLENNGLEGVTLDDSNYGVVRGNIVRGNRGGTGGIGVDKTAQSVIANNVVVQNAVAGLAVNNQVGSSRNGVISGNSFLQNGEGAIHLHSCQSERQPLAVCRGGPFDASGWSITGNTMAEKSFAVQIDLGSKGNVVIGNSLGAAPLLDRAGGNRILDNQ